MKQSPKCLNPHCYEPAKFRGLCTLCYQSAARLVRLKLVTWEELQKAGKCSGYKSGKHIKHDKRSDWLLSGMTKTGN